MSDHTHSAPQRGSFGRVLGLFLLLVIAALVGLYFYSVEARRAGDDAIGQARTYKQTIVSDYKRFYECMRSGSGVGSGPAVASADTARTDGAARPTGPYSAITPLKGASPASGNVPPSAAADAPSGMVADAPSAVPSATGAHSDIAAPAATAPSAGSENAPPAGLVVYPPYPDYPVFPQPADRPAARDVGPGSAPSHGQYPQQAQAETRPYAGPTYDPRAAYTHSPGTTQQAAEPVQPPMAGQAASGAQAPPPVSNLSPAWPQQPAPGMQAAAEPQAVATMPPQGTERTTGSYPYRAAPAWQGSGGPSYGAYAGTSPAQRLQSQPTDRAYAYSGYGGYPYYQRTPVYPQRAYPDQQAAAISRPETTMQPGAATQPPVRQPEMQAGQAMPSWQGGQSWQGAPPWQGGQSWQGAPPWQGMQPGQGATQSSLPWQGMQQQPRRQPGAGTRAPAVMPPQAAADGRAQYGPDAHYAPGAGADWPASPGMAYGGGREVMPNAPPSVRYDQLTASPPPAGPVMQGTTAPRQEQFVPGQAPGAMASAAPRSPYGSPAPQQWEASSAPPAVASYAPATGYAPQRAPLQPAPSVGAAGSEMNPLIASARQAYSSQHYQDAINSYRTLIAKGDDSPAVFGELGNVLLAAGRPQEAAQAYYEASSRLIDMGQPASVYLLLSHIETYDPLLGAILNRRLASLPRSLN